MIELARELYNDELARNVRFVAFVNEEPPYFQTELMGSYVYAQSLKNNNERIKGAIILEMLGSYSDKLFSQHYPLPLGLMYPNRANYVLGVGNGMSSEFLNSFEAPFEKSCGMPFRTIKMNIEQTGFSDNWSFWQNGYKAMMLTDTAFHRNFNYHTPEDTVEKLNFEYMSEAVKGIYFALKEMAVE